MPNNYETGARKPVERKGPDPGDAFSQQAAENRHPADRYGNTEPVDETNEKARHSDGQNAPGRRARVPEKPGGSEQPGYRMKRARFWQS
ncbi:hypothetical protein ACFFTN_09135 [Aminobacter aganoensis]|uniref:Uncharacterized protein n=1 Tax=Aminobacter aganoensis TaxID=83264 RepID=A0A7X0F861_9HYPH|nr:MULTISPECIES: hypothetical protein [Aminobacter]KQU76506.1 hypothetical protein ASC75_02525 [Aminobacter sp. DSM 101952]MBB6354857.1 hypothetical protein [Aminobacter aganoensis]